MSRLNHYPLKVGRFDFRLKPTKGKRQFLVYRLEDGGINQLGNNKFYNKLLQWIAKSRAC